LVQLALSRPPHFFNSRAQAGTGSNHAVSALKFGILEAFLKLGWSVLLSDVDIATFANPFEHLHRDRDIEGARPRSLSALVAVCLRTALLSSRLRARLRTHRDLTRSTDAQA